MKNKYKSFKEFERDFDNAIDDILDDLSKELGDVADETVEIIKKRTRAGYGVDDNHGSKSKLDPLSPEYKKQRKKMKLSHKARWNKSNLTKTGSMLDSLESKVKDLSFTISPKGRDNGGVKNTDKTRWQEEKGRTYLRVSRIEINRITKLIQKKLTKIIDKLF